MCYLLGAMTLCSMPLVYYDLLVWMYFIEQYYSSSIEGNINNLKAIP